jgi:hypothetical protein
VNKLQVYCVYWVYDFIDDISFLFPVYVQGADQSLATIIICIICVLLRCFYLTRMRGQHRCFVFGKSPVTFGYSVSILRGFFWLLVFCASHLIHCNQCSRHWLLLNWGMTRARTLQFVLVWYRSPRKWDLSRAVEVHGSAWPNDGVAWLWRHALPGSKGSWGDSAP